MKDINPGKILEIFNDTASGVDHDDSLQDVHSHGYIILGMVIRGVENYYILNELMSKRYGEDFKKVEESVKRIYFTRLYKYLENFNLKDSLHLSQALKHSPSGIAYGLDNLIEVFEFYQEYEKCARVLEIKNSLTSS